MRASAIEITNALNEESAMSTVTDDMLPLQRAYHWEREQPHRIYLTQPMEGGVVRDYSWAQAIGEARRMAAYLQAMGREKGWVAGDRIAILSKNCAWWIMSDLAIWMAGYVSVPLYPTLNAATVRQILEHSESRALFVGKLDDWRAMKPGVPAGLPCISYPASPKDDRDIWAQTWDEIVARTEPMAGDPVRKADELATIIYTSGTTGVPKGVMHAFRAFAVAADAAGRLMKATPDDRVLSHLPLSHVAERYAVETNSLFNGFRVYFAESLDTFVRDLQTARPTLFATVPRIWAKFQQGVYAKLPKEKQDRLFRIPILGRLVKKKILKGLGLDQCRAAWGGAAPMPVTMLNWYRSLGLELLEAYGMTENFAISHVSRPGLGRPGYVGTVYPGVECKLSEQGEVLVKSPCNMLGYYKEPQMTAEVLSADGWLRTGDRGEIDADGRLRITGRVKELFKTSKGKYVAPAPIENRISAHPRVEACCVTGANCPQPFALIMLPADAAKVCADSAQRTQLLTSLEQHLESVNAQLDPHEQMDFWAVVTEQWTVENGFITPTLKVKRNVVEKHYEPHFETWAKQRKPVIWHGA
jgi:long-chain acyl-CoA synthetase